MEQAIVRQENGQGIAAMDFASMREQAKALVASGFLPKAINTAEKAIAVMLTGRELGLGPMQALRSVHIIDGKPTLSAELIAGLVHRRVPGAVLRVAESTNDACSVEASRPGQQPTRITWTMDDAKAAGLTGKDNWKKYPRAMLRSRAITEAARAVFPDATMGLYDPDELGAITTPDGEVIEPQLPRISPHGEVIEGDVYMSPEFADGRLRAIEECETLEQLAKHIMTVDALESFHPEDRKRLGAAHQRRKRELSKPARDLDTKAKAAQQEDEDL